MLPRKPGGTYDQVSNFCSIISDLREMTWRYSGLVLCLLFTSLLPGTIACIAPATKELEQPLANQHPSYEDAETIFACGQRLPLHCAEVSSLEMISGISDTVAFQLIDAKEHILASYTRGDSELASLQRVRGVGPATGKLLSKHIRLEGICPAQELFEHTLR